MSTPERIPALDRLGADLGQALRTRPARRRWPVPPFVAALVALVAFGVPATATQLRWAEPHGAETALPAQAPSALRLTAAHGSRTWTHEAWRLVLYRARFGARAPLHGPVGLCAYVTFTDGGSGQCSAAAVPTMLDVAGSGDGVSVVAGVVPVAVRRVDLWFDGARRRTVVPRPVPGEDLRRHGLPAGLAIYALSTRAVLLGATAYDGEGHEVATSGRPLPAPRTEHP